MESLESAVTCLPDACGSKGDWVVASTPGASVNMNFREYKQQAICKPQVDEPPQQVQTEGIGVGNGPGARQHLEVEILRRCIQETKMRPSHWEDLHRL